MIRANALSFGARALSLIVAPALLAGCASLGPGSSQNQRKFAIESSWVRPTTAKEYLGYRRLNRMSPLVLEKSVIQGNAIDGIVAYDRQNGSQLWRLNIENGVEGGAQVVGENLYFGAGDGLFYCVNVNTGKVLWTFPVRAETLAAPTVENGVVYVLNGADVVFALDAATGKQLWLYNRQVTGNFSIRASTRPVVSGESLFVGFSDGFIVALKKRDGGLLWEKKIGTAPRFRDVDSTPVVDGDSLYVASYDGTLYSLNASSGDVNWQLEEGAYVPVTLGSGAFSDRLYYSTASSRILVLDKKSGKLLHTIDLHHGIPTQVSFYKNLMVYGESEGAIVVADAETGSPIQRFYPGHGLMARPTVIEGTDEAYIMSNGANLFALKLGYQRVTDRLPWQKAL